jgi:hypothetical protein
MGQELDDKIELEKMKMQGAALGTHPSTQTDFLKKLFELEKDEDEEFSEEGVEWKTPQTEEELQELNRYLDSI